MGYSLHSTKNYSLFSVSEFNRDIRKTAKLRQSMREHGYIPAYPLHTVRIEGKLKIKAGHHRFDVAKDLGIAVWYVVSDDAATLPQLESSVNPWSLTDFVKSWCRSGSAPHLAVHEFSTRTGIPFSPSAALLAGELGQSSSQQRKLKDGSYQITDSLFAETVGRIVVSCTALGFPFAATTPFVCALARIVLVSGFDPSVFLHRVQANPQMLRRQATVDQYLDCFEQIYNHQARNKVALAFLAKQAARQLRVVKLQMKRAELAGSSEEAAAKVEGEPPAEQSPSI